MSIEPYLSQIMIVAFSFPPKGWALCNGQFLPINQNQALFALLGTTYGGNGQTTFALPNLRGRAPVHMGDTFALGQPMGSTSATIDMQTLPGHGHPSAEMSNISAKAGGVANTQDPTGNFFGENAANEERFRDSYDDQMGDVSPLQSQAVGGSQSHQNMMPYLVLNYVIALQGIFPSRN